jgi:hypothetical protein
MAMFFREMLMVPCGNLTLLLDVIYEYNRFCVEASPEARSV